MHFADLTGVLASIRFLLSSGESGHPHLLGMLPDFTHWSLLSIKGILILASFSSYSPLP